MPSRKSGTSSCLRQLRRRPARLCLCLCTLFVLPVAASASRAVPAAQCGVEQYAYAGIQSAAPAFGVQATVTSLDTPAVEGGHVAAWVGVGGPGVGPSGSSEWVQVGLSAFSTDVVNLYEEVAQPGRAPVYTPLESGVVIGRSVRLGVVELAGRPDWWQVSADGRARGAPVHLPGSHGRWAPIATGESWTESEPICNSYRFRFASVRVAAVPGGSWAPIRDHYAFNDAGYGLAASAAGFVARRSPSSLRARRLIRVK